MGKDWGGGHWEQGRGNGDQLGATGTNWDSPRRREKTLRALGPGSRSLLNPGALRGSGGSGGGGQRGPEGPKAGGHREDLGRTLQ